MGMELSIDPYVREFCLLPLPFGLWKLLCTYIFRIEYPLHIDFCQYCKSIGFRFSKGLMHLDETNQIFHFACYLGSSAYNRRCRISASLIDLSVIHLCW